MAPSRSDAARPSPFGRPAIVHPFPSVVAAAVTGGLAVVAGGDPWRAGLAAAAMLGFQCSIGALNDLVDAPRDAIAKPWKPIPSGRVTGRTARVLVVAGGGVGLAGAAVLGAGAFAAGAVGYAAGVSYDTWLRGRGLGWLAFVVGLPMLPVFAWLAAVGVLPPHLAVLLPLAAIAGPALHLANGMVDPAGDARTGARGPATPLGPKRSLVALAGMVGTVQGIAWVTLLLGHREAASLAITGASSTIAALGLGCSAGRTSTTREVGWALQAVAMALLAVGWLGAATR